MKFTIKGGSGSGSNYPGNFEDLSWYDGSPFRWGKFMRPALRKALDFETNQDIKLEANWFYKVFFKGSEIYNFHTYFEYCISEVDTPPTDQQLRDVIKKSHEYLVMLFNERRKEHPILGEISPLPEEAILQTVDHLRQVLLDLPK